MASTKGAIRITDGSVDFSGGVDSGRVATLKSDLNPLGLSRNQLAWGTSLTVRGGGINQRAGWVKHMVICKQPCLFQGGYMYEPDNDFPYLILDISGRNFQVRVDTDFSVRDITGPLWPAATDQHHLIQGEQFLIEQNGSNEPRVWDGAVFRNISAMGGVKPYLPTGFQMDYFMGRLWIGNGREYLAGDIVRGPSGTAKYGLRDSILHSIENTYLSGGGAFTVPTVAGNIRAINHTANLDTALGEGRLFVFTRKTIYACNVTPTRADWATLKEPLQTVVQRQFGTTSDRCVVPVNGDLFFQSVDGVRSLLLAIRYFDQWGNTPISREMNRVLRFNNLALSRFGWGVNFDNRLLQSVLPRSTNAGVVSQGVMALDFDLVSQLGQKQPPVWEGMWEGLDILQAWVGDFGGRERCFAAIVSRITGDIELWELTKEEQFDQDDRRVTWYFETPAYTWGNSFSLKELDSGEFWYDRIFGNVDFLVEYRVDQNQCWTYWHQWRECVARTSCETVDNPICYPEQPFCEGYRATATLPKPRPFCDVGGTTNGRTNTIGYQFQIRVTIKGFCRIRGILLHALPRERQPYAGITC